MEQNTVTQQPDNTPETCAAVGLKAYQILEHFRHLFLYMPCYRCRQMTGVDPQIILKTCQMCIEKKLLPITLCSECHEQISTQQPHDKIEVKNPLLDRKIHHIAAERN